MYNKKNMSSPDAKAGFAIATLALSIAAFSTGSAHAGETVSFSNGGMLDWSLTTSYGLGVRLSGQDSKLLGDINGDDGNRNFDRHSVFTNRLGVLGELMYEQGNHGAVLRASAFYDDAYHGSNDHDSPLTANKAGRHNNFTSRTESEAGGTGRILDAYVYGNYDLPDNQRLSIRAGRHLIAWGEGLFYPGVNGVQGPVDVTKASQPGVETKEILLPVGQVSANWDINPSFGLSAYYQYEWKGNELNPVGSFYSTSDVVGGGREFLLLEVAPGFYQQANYAGTNDPRDSGQYGVRAMYRPNIDWEFGLFHVRYHDRNPAGVTLGGLGLNPISPFLPTTYEIDYYEDIKLTGFSFSTRIGDTQVGGEWSYRSGAATNVWVPTAGQARHTRGDGQQMQLSFIHMFGDMPWAQATTFMGEVIHVRLDDADAIDGFDDYTYREGTSWQSKSATAYTLQAVLSYPGFISGGWDLNIPLSWEHVLEGRTPIQGAIGSGQHDKSFSVGASFKRLGNLELSTTYTNFLGSASLTSNRMLADRDNITFAAKYSF